MTSRRCQRETLGSNFAYAEKVGEGGQGGDDGAGLCTVVAPV